MAHVTHKLRNSLEGALAGGGDPATSPLYVFGPFLKMIVVAGVAQITFGASIWLAVLTIAVVSAMYRLVMLWVTDGSGGSGLSEEEFGGWAVKVNAAITFIEYTLTFLVSMAAMVTFIADRFPVLNQPLIGIPLLNYRKLVAILLSILVGWLVNRGPRMAARAFGPATAGVLLLLWVMIISAIWKTGGIHLPILDWRAFTQELNFTLGGYVRILAVMTGIEVFANLVAAYQGPAEQKSRKAFNSLLIIMGTTAVTMLVVGPAILEYSDPTNPEISVFTQTMDQLLPGPLAYAGTLVGIVVLMSASAASAQGLQNLALGLRRRHYIPPTLGKRNRFGVADKPVWLQVAIVSLCFLLLGTREETYLAMYAAGVFILLSMTGWAVTKRLIRGTEVAAEHQVHAVEERDELNATRINESSKQWRKSRPERILLTFGVSLAAVLTTGAALLIFYERFLEGAWTYFIFVPALYVVFGVIRSQLGEPSAEEDYLGQLDAAQLAGFGFGQVPIVRREERRMHLIPTPVQYTWQPAPIEKSNWRRQRFTFKHIVVLLDGSEYAAQALPFCEMICKATGAQLTLLSSDQNGLSPEDAFGGEQEMVIEDYLRQEADRLASQAIKVNYAIRPGPIAEITERYLQHNPIDLVVTSTRGKSGQHHWLSGGLSRKLIQRIDKPVLLVQPDGLPEKQAFPLRRILVSLDGSIFSESVLPYARAFAKTFGSELILLTVPQVPEAEDYRAAPDVIESIRARAEDNMCRFLSAVARDLGEENMRVRPMVTGSQPANTIIAVSEEEEVDMVMLTSRGRGGLGLLMMGSVAQNVIQNTNLPVFMVPVHWKMN